MFKSLILRRESFRGFTFENISYGIFIALIFFTPLLLAPSGIIPFQLSKSVLSLSLIFLSLILYVLASIKKGSIAYPRHLVSAMAIAVVLTFVLSAFAGGAARLSFFGFALESGTVIFILAMMVAILLVPTLFSSREKIFYGYLAFFLSFVVLVLVILLRLVNPSLLTFGILAQKADNILGSWTDVGIISGAMVLLSLLTLEMVSLSKLFRIIIWSILVASLILLALVNQKLIWILVAVVASAVVVYRLGRELLMVHSGKPLGGLKEIRKKFTPPLILVYAFAIIFLVAGSFLSSQIASSINLSYVTVQPSWYVTFDVAKSALKDNLLLGVGPNRFNFPWLLYRPDFINTTPYWNLNFDYGVGTIPTFMVTTGLLGMFAILGLMVAILSLIIRSLWKLSPDPFSRYLIVSSATVSIYFWVVLFYNAPGSATLTLAFLFFGLFLSSIAREGILNIATFSFSGKIRKARFAKIIGALSVVFFAALLFMVFEKTLAAATFRNGANLFSQGRRDDSRVLINQAIVLDPEDLYYRSLADIDLADIADLVNKGSNPSDQDRQKFQELILRLISNAEKAVAERPTNYENWLYLGNIYRSLTSLGIEGAYEQSSGVFAKARELNPQSPLVPLLLARLEVTHGDLAKANDFIQQSLDKKPDYNEALFLISQIEVSLGNVDNAIAALQATINASNSDPMLNFQLGLLHYNKGDFVAAIKAFEQATAIVPDYANAKYFLGLSYETVGQHEKAISEFRDISILNPENSEVTQILENLRAGREPFSNLNPPITSSPEKREELPIEE